MSTDRRVYTEKERVRAKAIFPHASKLHEALKNGDPEGVVAGHLAHEMGRIRQAVQQWSGTIGEADARKRLETAERFCEELRGK